MLFKKEKTSSQKDLREFLSFKSYYSRCSFSSWQEVEVPVVEGMAHFWAKGLSFGVRAISGKGSLGVKLSLRFLVSVCIVGGGWSRSRFEERRDLEGSKEMEKKGHKSYTLLKMFLRFTWPLPVPSAPKSPPWEALISLSVRCSCPEPERSPFCLLTPSLSPGETLTSSPEPTLRTALPCRDHFQFLLLSAPRP